MKKTLSHIIVLALIGAMTISAFALAESADPAIELAKTIAADVDFTAYPADFADWDIPYLKIYLRETGVMANNSWVFDVTSNDLNAIGCTAGTMYIDVDAASCMDMIFFYDVKEDESLASALELIRKTEAIGSDLGEDFATPMDAILGGFCFSYTLGLDEDHMTVLRAAIYALADHFEIEPDFIYQ